MDIQTPTKFTTSMKPFDDDPFVEHFFTIDGTMVVFNTKLVDSITVLGDIKTDHVAVRLNNHDGTCMDAQFSLVNGYVVERRPAAVAI